MYLNYNLIGLSKMLPSKKYKNYFPLLSIVGIQEKEDYTPLDETQTQQG